MKNLLFSIIATALMLQTNAQEQDLTTTIKIGAKAGINFSTITGDLSGIEGRTSFHLGGMAEIPISEKLSAQPELLFSSQGAKYSDEGTLILNYVNAPILLKYYIKDELSLEIGPQIGYLLSAKVKYDTDDNGNTTTPDTVGSISRASAASEVEDVKSDVKSFDAGLLIGIGYKLNNGINIGARYNLGLLDGNNFDNSFGKFKNSVFQISVGYFFL